MSAIKNYGHLWERKYINFGKPNNPGNLNGKKSIKGVVIDFRKQIGIYILHDQNHKVVYVGQAGTKNSLFNRLKNHTKNNLKDRWEYFSWFGLLKVNNDGSLSKPQKENCIATVKEALDEIEAVLLQILEPKLNKQGARWGKRTIRYEQIKPK